MPRRPRLFFSDWAGLNKLLSCLNVVAPEPKKAKGRPYDPADLEAYAAWDADRTAGMKWGQIAKKRLPGKLSGIEKIKQGVRRYRRFCDEQGVTDETLLRRDAPLVWKDEWREPE